MATFEEILAITTKLDPASADKSRAIEWCDASEKIAVSRQKNGRIEIFLIGDRIYPRSAIVASHLEHDSWRRVGGSGFDANRIVFPAAKHFDAVVAFIVEELVRNAGGEDVVTAFSHSEPVIELALRRTALSDEVIIGLLAELKFLEVLLVNAETPAQRAGSLSSWQGFRKAARDFEFSGQIAVEVKSTRASRSSHVVSSLKQVDPDRNESGDPVERLFLFSVGFVPVDAEQLDGAIRLPDQVDRILALLGKSIHPGSRNEAQEIFLCQIAEYGGSTSTSYLHDEMRGAPAYDAAYSIAFQRLYNMNDPKLDLLRRRDVEAIRHIDTQSVTYTVDLPDQVDGDLNPEIDLTDFVRGVSGD